jgi:3',5'-cyclic AMP phosphodiesterase CpdA
MSILKYKDPETGKWSRSCVVKVVGIEGGSAPEQLKASGYPGYVTPEVADLVNRVNAARKDNSIVFVAMADSHYVADQISIESTEETNASAVQSNQAAKLLSYLIKPDFFAHLGDVSCGHSSTTPDMLKAQIEGFISLFREAKSDLPVFVCIGNHDTGIYYHDEIGDGDIHTMTGEYLYKNFTSLSESEDTVMGGEENGGYCYRDFADKKLRVIMLNTSEKLVAQQVDQTTYGAQRVWLANALLNLNRKADATEWGFIILSHYPADYGGTMPLSELLKAYVEGKSCTITDPVSDYYVGDETNETVNFSGYNGAKFIAQFHGHVHNFKTSKLYSYATGSGVQYDAHRVCIPNGQFNRENYYTTVGTRKDIDFSEAVSYPKTADTAEGTSFVVNVINPGEKKIYSFCYGAGYDRVIGFGNTVYYAVTSQLSNVTTSNDSKSVEANTSYTATLTPAEGYHFKSVTVMMGSRDITATAYKDGVVTIAKVTGNVVIIARGQMTPNFTNLVPLSVDKSGADFNVDGDGYDNDMYISTQDGVGYVEVIKPRSGSCTTGYMPVKSGAKVIRVAGDGCSIDPKYTKIATYDANFNMLGVSRYDQMGVQHSSGAYYQGRFIEEESTLFTLELEKASILAQGVYIRVCTPGDGAELIVTVDEEITYGS